MGWEKENGGKACLSGWGGVGGENCSKGVNPHSSKKEGFEEWDVRQAVVTNLERNLGQAMKR